MGYVNFLEGKSFTYSTYHVLLQEIENADESLLEDGSDFFSSWQWQANSTELSNMAGIFVKNPSNSEILSENFTRCFWKTAWNQWVFQKHWRPGLCHWPTFWERQPETAHSKRRGFGALFGDKCNKDDRWALGLDNWIRFNCWRIWRRCLNSHYWIGQGYMTLDLNAAKIFANAQGFRSL